MALERYEAFEGQQAALGYSQAVKVGDVVHVAGTLGIGEGMHLPDTMAEQMRLAYDNVRATLEQFGASLSDIVDQKVYVTDMDAAMAAAETRKAAFRPGEFPASTMVEVTKLALPGALIEISVTAYVGR